MIRTVRQGARRIKPAIGVFGSVEPKKVSSLPCGSKTRTIRNRSASLVEDEMNSLAAIGPVISVAFCSGGIEKVSPLSKASYSIPALFPTGVELRAMLAGSR
jgi:hypothetical protein